MKKVRTVVNVALKAVHAVMRVRGVIGLHVRGKENVSLIRSRIRKRPAVTVVHGIVRGIVMMAVLGARGVNGAIVSKVDPAARVT